MCDFHAHYGESLLQILDQNMTIMSLDGPHGRHLHSYLI